MDTSAVALSAAISGRFTERECFALLVGLANKGHLVLEVKGERLYVAQADSAVPVDAPEADLLQLLFRDAAHVELAQSPNSVFARAFAAMQHHYEESTGHGRRYWPRTIAIFLGPALPLAALLLAGGDWKWGSLLYMLGLIVNFLCLGCTGWVASVPWYKPSNGGAALVGAGLAALTTALFWLFGHRSVAVALLVPAAFILLYPTLRLAVGTPQLYRRARSEQRRLLAIGPEQYLAHGASGVPRLVEEYANLMAVRVLGKVLRRVWRHLSAHGGAEVLPLPHWVTIDGRRWNGLLRFLEQGADGFHDLLSRRRPYFFDEFNPAVGPIESAGSSTDSAPTQPDESGAPYGSTAFYVGGVVLVLVLVFWPLVGASVAFGQLLPGMFVVPMLASALIAAVGWKLRPEGLYRRMWFGVWRVMNIWFGVVFLFWALFLGLLPLVF